MWRHLPLSRQHPHAERAACAAEAAGTQDQYWAMHDELFHHQDHLTDETLLTCAEKLDLDLDRFRPTAELTEEDYDSMFGITRGVYFALQEAAKRLEDDGRIISISTAGAAQAMAGGGAYAGSKAAVEQFSRGLGRNSARAASRSTPSPLASPTPMASSWSRSRSTD